MSISERNVFALIPALLLAACATADTSSEPAVKGPGLGQPATAAEIALVDMSIPPSGAGLPPGSGDARAGAKVARLQSRANSVCSFDRRII